MNWAAAATALLCAATMGFAIQRGGTCMVAAVQALWHRRSTRRLVALAEGSWWVAGGLALCALAGSTPMLPPQQAIDRFTLIGGAALGLGAWINRACVFGTVARFGSGEWVYAFTPVGFYVGCLVANDALVSRPSSLHGAGSVHGVLAPLFLLFVLWRLGAALALLRAGRRTLGQQLWAPHAATIVIALTFLLAWLAAGRWAYTDWLTDLASTGTHPDWMLRGLLFAALLGGAVMGGYAAGLVHKAPLRTREALRCLAGGALMGAGSLFIPGSNDGLILVGLPLLQTHAVVALATMAATIIAAEAAAGALSRRAPTPLQS